MNLENFGEVSILIVDDEPDAIQLVANMLDFSNFDLYFADGGEQALDRLEVTSFDVTLLDIVMPEMNGFELARIIQNDPDLNVESMIFLTGQPSNDTVTKAFDSGGDDYVTKPVQREELLARVKYQLELSQYRHSLEEMVDQKTQELQRKNAALEELLDKYEERQKDAVEEVTEDLESFILPSVRKIKEQCSAELELLAETVLESFQNLSDPFTGRLRKLDAGLTGKEIEICHYIRQGLTTDEISGVLNVESETVKWHRGNIREKLGIKNEDVTLNEYLNRL